MDWQTLDVDLLEPRCNGQLTQQPSVLPSSGGCKDGSMTIVLLPAVEKMVLSTPKAF